ncbi:hypothetical protein MATL_G00175790 [Megalops atlanticus]|uniref:FGF n=1 Tax=Megalops atlanticus TaxID=7932 RepID=A0A9D3PS96_MEGAT|nr:hypothetical protein MATL_G00175790 [Megalops atlanticus]
MTEPILQRSDPAEPPSPRRSPLRRVQLRPAHSQVAVIAWDRGYRDCHLLKLNLPPKYEGPALTTDACWSVGCDHPLHRTVYRETSAVRIAPTAPGSSFPHRTDSRWRCADPLSAMRSDLSTVAFLVFHAFWLVCCLLQPVFGADSVNFSVHVENQTRVRDAISRRQHRVYQLYSRTSGKHIQVLGRRISARGEDGDKYAQLVVEADTFGSQVRIRGKETNYYLCMNHRGKLVGKKASGRSTDCVFVEMVLENHYTALMSARYAGWYVGFTKRGRPCPGARTLPNQQDVHFMKRPPPGEQPPPLPFRFTTVSKRSRRERAATP